MNNELKCDTCLHADICMYKKEFERAQHAADNLTISMDDRSMVDFKNIDFILPIQLSCKYYQRGWEHSKRTAD